MTSEITAAAEIVTANWRKNTPGNTGDESGRYEHGEEDEADGYQRARDLFHGLVGGVFRPRRAYVPLDVFDHDDGVVDDDADREDEREQRERVDRIAER